MGFDSQRAVVATGDGVVARFPGILCVARSADPDALRSLLALCAGVAGPDPGRALARRLATWMSGPDAPPDTLRFGTLAAAGAQVAVFLVGEVDAWIDGPDGAVLSGADAAIGTDRLLPVPDAPLVLSAGDVRLPDDIADVHDLRAGIVAGAGVVLHPAGPGGARGGPPAAAERSALPTPSPMPSPPPAGGNGHDWFAEPGSRPAAEPAVEERAARPAPRNGTAGHVNGRGSVAWPWPADAGAPGPARAGATGRHAILDAPGRREDQLLTGPVDLVDSGSADLWAPGVEATGRTAARPSRTNGAGGYGGDGAGRDPGRAGRHPDDRAGLDRSEGGQDDRDGAGFGWAGRDGIAEADADRADRGQADRDGLGVDRARADGADHDRADRDRADRGQADRDGFDGDRVRHDGADHHEAVRNGADLTRSDLTRSDLTRSDLTRSDVDGPDRDRAAGDGADRSETDRDGADRNGADRNGADRNGADRNGADRNGADRSETDRSDANRNGADRNRADRNRADRHRADRGGADREGADLGGTDRDPGRAGEGDGPGGHDPDDRPRDPARGHRNGRTLVDVTPYGVLSTPAPGDTTAPVPDPADSVPTGLVPTAPDVVPTDAVPEVSPDAVADSPDEPDDAGTAEPRPADDAPEAALTSGYLCSNGHLADPRAPFCGVCGVPVDDRAAALVEGSRPALGRLVFDDGATYTVDAGYLVGRMPEADERVLSGDLRPIIVEDRTGSVSRVHAAIEISGWDVMLLDVGSRNGTFVAGPEETGWSPLPAQRGRRLLPGTRVRLGGRTFVFESSSGVR